MDSLAYRGKVTRDSWWRGYSPYDLGYSDDYTILLDAFLVFQDDFRFSPHLVCLAKIFDIDENVLYRDIINLKDLKVSKTSKVVRKGKYFNDTFSLYTRPNFNHSTPSMEHIVIKVFTAAVDSLRPEFYELSSCDNQLRKDEFFDEFYEELYEEVRWTLNKELGMSLQDKHNETTEMTFFLNSFEKYETRAIGN